MINDETRLALESGEHALLSKYDVLRDLTDARRNRALDHTYVEKFMDPQGFAVLSRVIPIDDAAGWRCRVMVPVEPTSPEPVEAMVDLTIDEWDAAVRRTQDSYLPRILAATP